MTQQWVMQYTLLNASIILAASLLAFLLLAGALWRPEVAKVIVKIALAIVVVVVVFVAIVVILDYMAIL